MYFYHWRNYTLPSLYSYVLFFRVGRMKFQYGEQRFLAPFVTLHARFTSTHKLSNDKVVASEQHATPATANKRANSVAKKEKSRGWKRERERIKKKEGNNWASARCSWQSIPIFQTAASASSSSSSSFVFYLPSSSYRTTTGIAITTNDRGEKDQEYMGKFFFFSFSIFKRLATLRRWRRNPLLHNNLSRFSFPNVLVADPPTIHRKRISLSPT